MPRKPKDSPAATPETTDAKEPTKTLADRIRELKRGTKEAQAYAEIGDGMDRAKFRDAWFEVHPPRKGDVVPVDPKLVEKQAKEAEKPE